MSLDTSSRDSNSSCRKGNHLHTSLSKFACDHCRAKRLKCSRELPKCSNCRPWPGACAYSHIAPDKERRIEPSQQTERVAQTFTIAPVHVQHQLIKIESSLSELLDNVRRLNQTAWPSSQSNHRSDDTIAPHKTARDEVVKQTLEYQDRFGTLSPLSRINTDLEILRLNMSHVPENLDVVKSLQDLSENMGAVYGPSKRIREELREAGRSANLFYIPTREDGDGFIQTFHNLMQLAYPLYLPPPDDLIPKIVYEPFKVAERSWVVIFNCLVLSTLPANKFPNSSPIRAKFRKNIWIALNDTSIFFEPLLNNVTALITVATHGEDFTTPNLSWILTGYACRLLQAMNIHTSLGVSDSPIYMQRLFTFWSVFAIDKSVSLAFGRPCSLPTHFYDIVPLPKLADLTDFKPHQKQKKNSTFGATHFLQNIHLSKLQGRVLELQQIAATLDHAVYSGMKTKLKEELQVWHSETQQMLTVSLAKEILGYSNEEVIELKTGPRIHGVSASSPACFAHKSRQ
ncbi:hypothetical protein F5884DRAFT_899683 [Xylogone sp. PMI_703]|nr:hypothetical protein F5884DRAFT_899683 [Xylogone sp. PMI_703]